MPTCTYVCYDNIHAVRCLLHYLVASEDIDIEHEKGSEKTIEMISAGALVYFDKYSDLSSKVKNIGLLPYLGKGKYKFTQDEVDVNICVKNCIDDQHFLHGYQFDNNSFTKQITVTYEHDGNGSMFDELLKKSTSYIEKLKLEFVNKVGSLKKYIYDAKDCYWNNAHSTHYRGIESLFLKEGEKEKLISYIDNFVAEDTKEDYIKYNIPYKSNVLLYGKPGTGKTSTILTIASHVKTNIGLIPISSSLDDSALISALSDVKKNDCKIVVIEDIDCLFNDRKKHDAQRNSLTLSGLLNCMDGLFRADGIIVFFTTNRIEDLDEAMLRSARIDFKMEYTYADEYQIKQCFEYYFPKQQSSFHKFYEKVSYKQYTIADLQQFFFKYRKCDDILVHMRDLCDSSAVNKKQNSENGGGLYM